MRQRELIIRVSNERIFLNPTLSIPIQQTNIPKEHMIFRSNKDIFWKVEMLNYKADNKCLQVSVKDYIVKDITNFDKQEPKKPVDKLLFEKFDWLQLEPLLIHFQKSQLAEILLDIEADPFSRGEKNSTLTYIHPFASKQQFEIDSEVRTMTETIWFFFNDVHFMLGYVSFKTHIKKIGQEIEFKIHNENILAEFDNIKFWFAKKLKTKRIKVVVTITLKDNDISEIQATSSHIDQITPELIDGIKYQRTFALTKEPQLINPDKSLFTADEIFNQINTDDIEGNVFKQTEEDILSFFLEKSNIRNRRQIAYLAGKKQSEKYKLLYTLNPNFGFLFLIEGEENNHFVWELLNSHGTYIWSIEKGKQNVELQFKRIEDIINTVRASGREKYKQAYRNNHQDHDLVFRVINHEDIGSKLVDGFPKWKSKLNEQLT